MSTETKWTKPPKLSAVDVAFPAHVDWLPPFAEIPAPFREWHNQWGRLIARWFFEGPDMEWIERLVPATPDINKDDALRALQSLLGSFEPKHEHKMAGAAYLASLWFDDPALAPSREKQPDQP